MTTSPASLRAAAPPAGAVPVAAIEALVAKWRKWAALQRDVLKVEVVREAQVRRDTWQESLEQCATELTALLPATDAMSEREDGDA